MIKQIFALSGVIIGYIIAMKLYNPATKFFSYVEPGIAKIVSVIAIFIACIIAAWITGRFAGKIFKIAGLSWANRIGGGFLGFLKGSLIITIIVMLLLTFLPSGSSLLNNSVTLPYALHGIKVIGSTIPKDIKSKYEEKVKDLKYYWMQKEIKEKMEDEVKEKGKRQKDKR